MKKEKRIPSHIRKVPLETTFQPYLSFDLLNGITVLGKDHLDRWQDLLFIFKLMSQITPQTSVTTSDISLKPIQSIDNLVMAFKDYGLLKKSLLTESDYQLIKGKSCIKKSGFRKLACAFGISIEVTKETRLDFKDYFVYEITCRAISPNGRFIEACSSCASNEKEFTHVENDVRSIAQTRASNRAISDLIGGGEVSAEELELNDTSLAKSIDTQSSLNSQDNLEDSPAHIKGIVHKKNVTYESSELMTIKQKQYLIKLIEIKYPDEQTRAKLYSRLLSLTKREATSAIQKLLVA